MSRRRKGLLGRIRDLFSRAREIEEVFTEIEEIPEPEPPTIIERVVETVRDVVEDLPVISELIEPEEDEIDEDWQDIAEEYEEEEPLWDDNDLVFLQLQGNLTYNSSAGDWYKDHPEDVPDIIGEDEGGLLYNKTFRHDTASYRGFEIGDMPLEDVIDPENMQSLVKKVTKDVHSDIYQKFGTEHNVKEVDKPYGTFRLKDKHYVFYRTPKLQKPRVKEITDKDRIAELIEMEESLRE